MKKYLLLLFGCFFITVAFAQTDTTAVKSKRNTSHGGDHRFKSFNETMNSRYITSDEIGGLYGLTGVAKGKMFFSYHSFNGWQFNRLTYVGPGFGLEFSGKNGVMVNEGNSKNVLMVPLFVEIRHSFLSKRVSPFISQKAGYTFYMAGPKPSSTIIGGGMSQTQIGVKAFIAKNAAFNFSVGYRLQCLAVPVNYASQFSDAPPVDPGQKDTPKLQEFYHYLTFHVGFTY